MAAHGPRKRRRQSESGGEIHDPVAGDSTTTQTPNRSSVGAFNNADSYQQHLTPAARNSLVARPFKSTKCTRYSSPRDHIHNSMARRGDSRMAQTVRNVDSHQQHMALSPRKSLIVILPLKSSKRQRDPKAPSSDESVEHITSGLARFHITNHALENQVDATNPSDGLANRKVLPVRISLCTRRAQLNEPAASNPGHHEATRLHLLDLPAEIRNKIFMFIYDPEMWIDKASTQPEKTKIFVHHDGGRKVLQKAQRSGDSPPRHPIRACRQLYLEMKLMYQEACRAYWNRSTFVIGIEIVFGYIRTFVPLPGKVSELTELLMKTPRIAQIQRLLHVSNNGHVEDYESQSGLVTLYGKLSQDSTPLLRSLSDEETTTLDSMKNALNLASQYLEHLDVENLWSPRPYDFYDIYERS